MCWDGANHQYREIHPLDPQPHRHSMLVPRVCAPRVTRCSLGKYWSRDWFRGNFSLTQGLWNQQAATPGVHMLSMTHSGVRQRNLMTHAQCPLPVYYSQSKSSVYLFTFTTYYCSMQFKVVSFNNILMFAEYSYLVLKSPTRWPTVRSFQFVGDCPDQFDHIHCHPSPAPRINT